MMDYPKVSIIILNWNGLEDTIECLESLKNITYSNYGVILVDNGSKGNDADILAAKYGNYLTIIRNDKNYGFTGGNNIAIRHAFINDNPDYILLLNNDTTVDPAFLKEMVGITESDPHIGIAGPKTYFYDAPDRFWLVWFVLDMYKGQAHHAGSGEVDRGQYDNVKEVDYIAGSCFLIKRAVIESIGLLDDAYFAYWEEADYCARTRNAGYKILYAPGAKIWHKTSQTQIAESPLQMYYMTKNRFRFMKKQATWRQYQCFLVNFFIYMFWRQLGSCLIYHRSPRLLCALIRGVIDGLSLKV